MSFHLAVWRSEFPLSDREAAKHYAALSEGSATPNSFDSAVYAFHSQLIELYPELEMLSESEAEHSPWASSPDFSGVHVSIALQPTHYAEVFPVILHIAELNGLVCFDPQNAKVHLPSLLAEGKRKDHSDGDPPDSGETAGTPRQPKRGRRISDPFLEAIAVLSLAPFTYLVLPASAVGAAMGLGLLWSAASLLDFARPPGTDRFACFARLIRGH